VNFITQLLQKGFIPRTTLARRSVYAAVIMYRMNGWTGERLDDFARHVDQRFDAVDRRLTGLDDRFAALQRTLVLLCGGIIAALIGLIATQL
jgi:hypothetical protein